MTIFLSLPLILALSYYWAFSQASEQTWSEGTLERPNEADSSKYSSPLNGGDPREKEEEGRATRHPSLVGLMNPRRSPWWEGTPPFGDRRRLLERLRPAA